ncbi:MAG: hypothetical protein WCJ33_08195, partial [Pseudomonadota bacterium]
MKPHSIYLKRFIKRFPHPTNQEQTLNDPSRHFLEQIYNQLLKAEDAWLNKSQEVYSNQEIVKTPEQITYLKGDDYSYIP